MGNLIFNGISTEDLGLVIQAPPKYTFPAKDLSTSHVPGRNGDFILDTYCYNNVDRTYSIASVFRPGTDFMANAEKILKWLTEPSGYRRLEDTYDPTVYRLAMFSSSGSLSNYYDEATSIDVIFNCKPQRFLKIGEEKTDYFGTDITITNPTSETALPLITISGISKSNDNAIVLLTVLNKNDNKVSSSITISKLPDDEKSITFDSEDQMVYYEDQNGNKKDRNAYVNFNRTEFPKLRKGNTQITIGNYTESTELIEKYNNLLNDNEKIMAAKYQPYDAIIESRQKKFFVKKYTKLKLDTEEVYDAKAYLNLCNDKAETYSFKSYNSLLNSNGQVAAFIGIDSVFPEWLDVTDNKDGTLTCRLARSDVYTKLSDTIYGGYIMDGSDKCIRYVIAGNEIGTYKDTAVVNIKFYPAKLKAGTTDPELAIVYDDVPAWLSYEIIYNDVDHSPNKIIYKANVSSSGYYYTEKTNLFGKASWHHKSENESLELGSATWSTWKKAFVSTSGLSISTTAPFDYKYLSEAPQYDDITETKKDSDGNETTEVLSKVHFSISPTKDDLTQITAKATEDGYFRLNEAGLEDGFKFVQKGATIGDFSSDSTKSNTVYYLPGIPNYASDKEYPSWLYPDIYNTDGTPINSISPSSINFKVKEQAYYRYSYMNTETNKIEYTDWALLEKDAIWQTSFMQDKEYTVYMITEKDKLSEPFSYTDASGNKIDNIGFYDKNDTNYEGNVPPDFVVVSRVKGPKEDGSSDTIKYTAGKSGYFKWDSNLEWVYLEKGKEIGLGSTLTDDTTIHYLERLPNYVTSGPVHMEIEKSINGDPTAVKVLASQEGYFKPQSESDWIHYNQNDLVVESKISEETTIKYLVLDTDSKGQETNNIKISIIPRWWKI